VTPVGRPPLDDDELEVVRDPIEIDGERAPGKSCRFPKDRRHRHLSLTSVARPTGW